MFRLQIRSNVRTILGLTCFFMFLLSVPVMAATDAGELAWTGDRSQIQPLDTVNQWRSPLVDVNELLREDDENIDDPEIPWRVGFPMQVDLTTANSGTWEELPDGDRLWRLRITTEGALWTVLGFDLFRIQPGGLMTVYNSTTGTVMGPYGSADVRRHGELWFPPITGGQLIVEIYWPKTLAELTPSIHLGTVSHGYKPWGRIGMDQDPTRAFGDSGSCNIDTTCSPEADAWQDEKRGAVMVLVGGSGNCSGALINTTANDCRTYLLTADHCGENGPSTTIGFNYECPTCGCTTDPGNITTETLTGGVLLADFASSDFTLIEMDQAPPESYNAFFVGWSRDPNPASASWVISYPRGDVRKIAHDSDPPVDGSNWGPNHWRIDDSDPDPAHLAYEWGTTEPASSGSPLMDQNHRIIGQLHGGTASCSSDTYDEYGKIDASWVGGGSPATRLADWLDPLAADPVNSGAMFVDGIDHSICLYQPAGAVLFDRNKYGCSDTLGISLRDDNIPGDPATFDILVSSATEVMDETVTLTQIMPGVGRYSGTIPTSTLSPANGDGLLSVTDGDAITANYLDADDGAGNFDVTIKDNSIIDCQDPLIVGVTVSQVNPSSAVVTVDVNEDAQVSIPYGQVCGVPEDTATSSTLQTQHDVTLLPLQFNTTYYLTVNAQDEAGNTASDDNGGACYSFTTPEVPNFFTEEFGSDNDTDFLRFVFMPNGSVDFYSECNDPIPSFPSDPTGGTLISLTDDSSVQIDLTGGATVSIYGTSYSSFFVGSNGYITFGVGDSDYTETLGDHFDTPRISALFDDLNPASLGTVRWLQLADRAVVTWEGVPEYNQTSTNDFQIELFFNGVIAISYLDVTASDGIVGLSAGNGLSPDFFESDHSGTSSCGGGACFDGVLGPGEIRIDCGGPCPDCQCLADIECDDALFCNGVETCNTFGVCAAGGDPCADGICLESNNMCVDCVADLDCDDGLFCNGVEHCDLSNSCQPGPVPCPWTTCDDAGDACIVCDNDGSCEPGETCANCPNDCISGSYPVCGNNICEVGDGETCVSCPADCNNAQRGNPSARYCCGDGVAGEGPVTCADARCTGGGNTCEVAPVLAYCCGDTTCEDIETLGNCPADCTLPVPGEAGGGGSLRVTDFDSGTGILSISFGISCLAVDYTIQYSELTRSNLETYNWSGQECSLGAAGTYDWLTTGTPATIFFVVVANNGVEEGSYGKSSYGFERAEEVSSVTCPAVQNLQYACE